MSNLAGKLFQTLEPLFDSETQYRNCTSSHTCYWYCRHGVRDVTAGSCRRTLTLPSTMYYWTWLFHRARPTHRPTDSVLIDTVKALLVISPARLYNISSTRGHGGVHAFNLADSTRVNTTIDFLLLLRYPVHDARIAALGTRRCLTPIPIISHPINKTYPSIHTVYFRQKSVDNNRDKSNNKKHTSLATKHQ